MSTMTAQTTQVYSIFIRATPEQVWDAITKPEFTQKYFHGSVIESDYAPGSPYRGFAADRSEQYVEGEVLEADPPRKLVHTMLAHFSPEAEAEGTTRVRWDIEQVEDSCRLTVTHDEMREGANDQIYGGWPMILSGLKTWLETGELLTTPGSLMYGS
jgi:uncharacterized protein YndB with AHSA1/START domain